MFACPRSDAPGLHSVTSLAQLRTALGMSVCCAFRLCINDQGSKLLAVSLSKVFVKC
jgi:hypothetical protein